jgi:hypothetical protein
MGKIDRSICRVDEERADPQHAPPPIDVDSLTNEVVRRIANMLTEQQQQNVALQRQANADSYLAEAQEQMRWSRTITEDMNKAVGEVRDSMRVMTASAKTTERLTGYVVGVSILTGIAIIFEVAIAIVRH